MKIQSAFRKKRLQKKVKLHVQRAQQFSIMRYSAVFNEKGALIGLCGASGHWYVGTSMLCLSPWSPVRLFAIILVDNK